MCKRRTCTQPSNVKCLECYVDTVIWDRRNSNTTCERICSFANHYCWPGTCGGGLTKNCQCAPGFKLVSRTGSQIFSGETTCQIDTQPAIDSCRTVFVGPNGEKKDTKSSTSSMDCRYLQDTYGNYQPSTIEFDMVSSFSVDTSVFDYRNKPQFIREEHFGISDTTLIIKRKTFAGTEVFLSRHYQTNDTSGSTDITSHVANDGNISVAEGKYNVNNGEQLCLSFEAKAGGYLKSFDVRYSNKSGPIPYTKTTMQRQLCFRYDNMPPVHCQQLKTCSSVESLRISSRVTRNPIIQVSFRGWTDPIPSGGNRSHASSLDSYEISIHQVIPGNGLQMVDMAPVYSQIFPPSITNTTLNLTSDRPMLFGIVLEVKDVADNVQQARRFVLYDNTSFIETSDNKLFFVTSASKATSHMWQTHHSDICLNWEDHFYNLYYLDNALLDPVKPDPHGLISGIYEQTDGLLPVNGTPNIAGIIGFKLSWSLNNGAFSSEIAVPDFLHQNFCRNFNVNDGQIYTFNLRPIDIVGNTYDESKTVHIDRSHPHIYDLWLVKDGYEMVYVHNSRDLSGMNMTFEARDPHSGLRDIEWSFGIEGNQTELMAGHIAVQTLDTNCSVDDEKCYCPDVGDCEQYSYSIPLDNSQLNNTHVDDSNMTYYFTIKVTNNAQLSTVEHINVLIDESQPKTGDFYEDPVNSTNLTFPIQWYGFNDNESGIHSYHLGLSHRCLSKSELYNGNGPDIEYYTELPSSSTFITLPTNLTQKVCVTIIALNNAMTSSEPVCSTDCKTERSSAGIEDETDRGVSSSVIGGIIGGCVMLLLGGCAVVGIICKRHRKMCRTHPDTSIWPSLQNPKPT